ncbi:MAG TPA: NUDIX domain-containing protein [Actinomycetota bacterium]
MDPRPAATVVVARPAERGVEVLILRRSASSRFAPGFLVFPGGVVEERDAALAVRLFGRAEEAPRACAVRELYEETSLLLTRGGLEPHPDRPPLEGGAFEPPALEDVVEIARWVAPESLAERFDAIFYAVAAPRGLDPVPDRVEADDAWWADPEEVVVESTRGESPLMWPTLITLERLASVSSVEEVLSMRIEQLEPGLEERPARVRGAWRRPEGRRP